mmetsp:Transcript_10479/g.32021  ORF Transcript_10479/g.32021 Transcript_10479/m.32021 type:complete len:285 (-) Transcript_10479:424-1278(-)
MSSIPYASFSGPVYCSAIVFPSATFTRTTPPKPVIAGRTCSRTKSQSSTDSSLPRASSASDTAVTLLKSAKFSLNTFSTPICMVVVELGHEPQAPSKRTFTSPPSTASTLMLPPSATKYGRTSSSTASQFSLFRTIDFLGEISEDLEFSANGLTTESEDELEPFKVSSVCLLISALQSPSSTADRMLLSRCLRLYSSSDSTSPMAFLSFDFFDSNSRFASSFMATSEASAMDDVHFLYSSPLPDGTYSKLSIHSLRTASMSSRLGNATVFTCAYRTSLALNRLR